MKRFAKLLAYSLLMAAFAIALSPLAAKSADFKSWTRSSEGYYVNSKGEEIAGALRRGVDVSEFNGTIDWAKAQADDVSFAIIRVGGRYMNSRGIYYDSKFERNIAECERLGIPYGVYFFSTAKTAAEAREEAQVALNRLKGHNPSMPIYIDLEWTELASTSNRQLLATVATAFCETIEAAGYEAGVYASTSWWVYYLTDPCFDRWTKWVAQYNVTCTYTGSYDMWQCTGSGSVAGFSGSVDINMDFRPTWTTTGTWVEEDGGLKYRYPDGSYLEDGLYQIDGKLYCFDSAGAVCYGWQLINDIWYYFGSDGAAYANQWLVYQGYTIYFGVDSKPIIDAWQQVNGAWYCFDAYGHMVVNAWASDDKGGLYYLNSKGRVTTNSWVATDGSAYYVGSNGKRVVSDWVLYQGRYYYFGADGKLVTNTWQQVSGAWYRFDAYGNVVVNAWAADDKGTLYYLNSKGRVATNAWVKTDGAYYYVGADGKRVVSNWVVYKGRYYYLGADGKLVTNAWQKVNGSWYRFDANGNVVTNSWVKTDGLWYYVGSNGKPLVNTSIVLNGIRYYFGSSGYCTGYKKVA